MIAIDLSKQQALDADPKVIQQIDFAGNLENNVTMFCIIEEGKETFYIFHKELYCTFNFTITQYNTLNVKLSHLQLNKLKSGIKNGTQVSSNLLSNVIGNFNDKTNFPHRLLLTNTQVSRLCIAFANN